MGIKPYLILNLQGTRYAIAAASVREIFFLPELTPIAEAPPDIVGLLNLHGQYVPVMHLDLRFGRQVEECQLTDSVAIVESGELLVGIIVHQVETVTDIDDRYIQTALDYGREQNINQAFIQGVINLDDETIMLLDVDNLVRHPDALTELVEPEAELLSETTPLKNDFYEGYFTQATPHIREILHQRARELQEVTKTAVTSDLISLAVVSIAGRYFGFDLSIVREFTNIGRVTQIPCCPQHIVGNMNLRGEILTLVDLGQSLNLGNQPDREAAKAVVVEVDDIIVGVVVEEVYDVVDFQPEELKSIPVATDNDTANYLKGLAVYQDHTLNAIDLPRLLTQGAMTVELTA